jgi:phosphotransferase system IIB component
VTAVGSRINLTLKDKDAINREKLTEYGVKSVLVMSNKVTLVKEKAVDTAQAINEALQ